MVGKSNKSSLSVRWQRQVGQNGQTWHNEEVLQRAKFAQRLSLAGVASHTLVMGYAALAWLIEPAVIEPVIIADPDDDVVLACAIAARAEAIVSGDNHLLNLKQYEGIPIFTAAQLLARIEKAQSGDT